MKLRNKVLILTAVAAAMWVGSERGAVVTQTAHEFLTHPEQVAAGPHRVEPVQLAVLMQGLR